jgi:signal transduction histidine kinase
MPHTDYVKMEAVESWSDSVTHRPENVPTGSMADSIRILSALVGSGAGCAEIVTAAGKSAAALLPGARVGILSVDEKWKSVTMIDGSRSLPGSVGTPFPVPTYSDLRSALEKPQQVCRGTYRELARLFNHDPAGEDTTGSLVVYKVMPCNDETSMVMMLVVESRQTARAEAVVNTLGELLASLGAGHDAATSLGKNLGLIARAKSQWETAVDLMPELVCLLDTQGRVIRINRTVERWSLGKVSEVQGKDLHDLLHPACQASPCAMKCALGRTLKGSSNGPGSSAITDPVLNRTVVVNGHLMSEGSVRRVNGEQPSTLVVISDISPLHKAQLELWKLNKTLEDKVRERTAELEQANKFLIQEIEQRRKMEAEMRTSSEDLESLSEQLLNVQESERRRLSAELHDSIEQSLRAIKYSLERVSVMHDNPDLGDPAVAVDKVIEQVVGCIKETRTLVTSLRPLILDDMGPASAISWLCRHFGDIYRETEFRADVDVTNAEIPPSLATPVYRIIQEGLNNVIKHAQARAVMVTVCIEDGVLKVEVLDDGVGFDTGSIDTTKLKHLGSYGRLGMRRRALNSGGFLTLDSRPGKGTRLHVEWTLAELESE